MRLIRALYGRWRAGELIRSVPPKDLPQLRAKVAAMEVLKGHRADLGLQRAWEGDYITLVSTRGGTNGGKGGLGLRALKGWEFGNVAVGFSEGRALQVNIPEYTEPGLSAHPKEH